MLAEGEFTQGLFFRPLLPLFCSLFLLHEKVCAFSSALLHAHTRTNHTFPYNKKVFRTIFLTNIFIDLLEST